MNRNNEISKISMGVFNFTNSLPINYPLYEWGLEKLVLSDGYPALINQLMEDRQIHVAPVSSIEYIKNSDKYALLDNICISSDGDVDSVMLFSNCYFEDLEEKIIGVPYTSSTSIALLKVLLNERMYDLSRIKFQTHRYKSSLETALNGEFDAVLYIGDPALIANIKSQGKFKKYDLGRMWKDLTGLPMTFATWITHKDWKEANEEDFEWLQFVLSNAAEAGLNKYFNEVVNSASKILDLDRCHVEDYLTNKIKYNFTEAHKEGLDLFRKLYGKIGSNDLPIKSQMTLPLAAGLEEMPGSFK